MATSGALATASGMSPCYDVMADDSHVYSAHGTTLARISASGDIETLSVPDVRRIAVGPSHVYGATTSSGGQLVIINKNNFNNYSTVAVNVGSGATYANSLDGLALDTSGDVWIVGRRTGIAFGGVRLAKYVTSTSTWSSAYTLTNSYIASGSVGFPLALSSSDAYVSTHRFGGNGQLFRIRLSDGSQLSRVDLSGIPSQRLYVEDAQLYEGNNIVLQQRNVTTLAAGSSASFSTGGYEQAVNKCAFHDGYAYAVNGAVSVNGRFASVIELSTMTAGADLSPAITPLLIQTRCDSLAFIAVSALSGIFVGAVVF